VSRRDMVTSLLDVDTYVSIANAYFLVDGDYVVVSSIFSTQSASIELVAFAL